MTSISFLRVSVDRLYLDFSMPNSNRYTPGKYLSLRQYMSAHDQRVTQQKSGQQKQFIWRNSEQIQCLFAVGLLMQ